MKNKQLLNQEVKLLGSQNNEIQEQTNEKELRNITKALQDRKMVKMENLTGKSETI